MSATSPTVADIEHARERGRTVVHQTPLLPSSALAEIVGVDLWFKAENFERTGSFKIRGAMNALSLLSDEQKTRGVVAASAGNHAQGVALAARELGITATVFMPESAAIPKIAATHSYGATVRLVGANLAESVDHAAAFVTETGASLIHPYDDPDIVAGQGTLGLELLEQLPEAGTVVIPVGGAGLISGTSLALKALRPDVHVMGVQSAALPTYVLARASGVAREISPEPTVADGIAVSRPSQLCFELIERTVDDLVTVDDDRITEAVALLLERSKLLVEPAGATGLAALIDGKVEARGAPVVVVLSGGNIDLLLLDGALRHGLGTQGRFASLRVLVPDQPGRLASVVTEIGRHGGNVLSVEHHREETGQPFGKVEIHVTMETRSRAHFEEILDALSDYEASAAHAGRESGSPG